MRGAVAAATARIFRAAGKPAPPRPVSPACSTSAISSAPWRRNGTGPYLPMCPASGSGPSGGSSLGSCRGGSGWLSLGGAPARLTGRLLLPDP